MDRYWRLGLLALVAFLLGNATVVAAPAAKGAAVVTGVTANISPNTPGVPARLTVQFTVSGQLDPGDEIIITLEDDWQVPDALSTSLVNLRASDVTNECGGITPPTSCPVDPIGGPFSNSTVNPDGVRIDFVGVENDMPEIALQVPDMSTDGSSGTNSIAAGATVTVIFMQSDSGILNPSEASFNDVFVSTSNEPTIVAPTLP